MSDAEVECSVQDRALGFERLVVADVVPETQGDRREVQAACPAPAVVHRVVPRGVCRVAHASDPFNVSRYLPNWLMRSDSSTALMNPTVAPAAFASRGFHLGKDSGPQATGPRGPLSVLASAVVMSSRSRSSRVSCAAGSQPST